MAITQLTERPGLGEVLGTGLGSGLSSGLQALANDKLQEMRQKRRATQLEQGLIGSGVDPSHARAISVMPPALQVEAAKNVRRQGQSQLMAQQLGGQQPGGQQLGGQQPGGITSLFGVDRLSPEQQLEVDKAKTEQAKEARKEKRERWTQHKDFMDETYKKLDTSRKNIVRFDTLDKLTKSGKLSHPTYYSLLKKIGLDIPTLLNPGKEGSVESEVYNKTVQDFVSDIKDVFGARITEKQIEVFLKSLPTLENTDEGKQLIIKIMKLKHQAVLAKGQAIEEIIDESGGMPPYNLRQQLNSRQGAIYDQLATDINSAIDASTSLVEGPKSLIGKEVDANFSVPDGATGTDANGNPIIRVNGEWVLNNKGKG